MGVRHHDLAIGEKCWDDERKCFGVITQIYEDDETVVLNTRKCPELNEMIDNRDYPEIISVDFESCYQIVPNAYDREGNIVCYEHNYGIDYPYYAPLLEENLFESEVDFGD